LIEITEELEKIILHRGKAYQSSKHTATVLEDSDGEIINSSNGEVTQALYCRSSECEKVTLEEFQLVSVIGRGNFGKVSELSYSLLLMMMITIIGLSCISA
jgi:hypothetical protein